MKLFRDIAIYTIDKNDSELKTIKNIVVLMKKNIQRYDLNRSKEYINLIDELLKNID